MSLLYLPLRKGRAAAAFEAAKLRVTGSVLDFAGDARAAFYDLQAAEQLLEMRRSVVEATAASFELAQRLREAGNNRDLDVANERAVHEESRVQLALAEARVIMLRERMNEIIGLWGAGTTWRTASRLPAIPEQEIIAEGLERRAVESSLDLDLARREIEVAARELGIAKPFALLDDTEVSVAAEREVEGGWSVGPAFALPVPLLPNYMTMGRTGMSGMTEMGMKAPPNSIPMVGGIGPYDEITMGGMFTILKVRENLTDYDSDPGWYEPPAGPLTGAATADALRVNDIAPDASSAPRAPDSAKRSWPQASGRPGAPGRAPDAGSGHGHHSHH